MTGHGMNRNNRNLRQKKWNISPGVFLFIEKRNEVV